MRITDRNSGKNRPWKLTRHSSAKFLDVDGSDDDEMKIDKDEDEEKIEDTRSKSDVSENKVREEKDTKDDDKEEEEKDDDDAVEKEDDGEWTHITQNHQSRLSPSLEKGEKLIFETTAEIISPLRACPGRLVLTNSAIHFLYDDEPDNIASSEGESNKKMSNETRGVARWSLGDVKDIQPRRYLLSPSSLEFSSSLETVYF